MTSVNLLTDLKGHGYAHKFSPRMLYIEKLKNLMFTKSYDTNGLTLIHFFKDNINTL